ncbi:MAG TPA: DciA family protein [Terriglobales bacterium]|nr:DciA family protein [Terriglobales bacterium]
MQRLGDILELLPTPPELAPVLAWSLAAGPALAPLAQCRGLRDGVLTLLPADAAARRQLASVTPELLLSLNRTLGAGRVQRLQLLPPAR